jgi:hypothetical protein
MCDTGNTYYDTQQSIAVKLLNTSIATVNYYLNHYTSKPRPAADQKNHNSSAGMAKLQKISEFYQKLVKFNNKRREKRTYS